MNYLVERLESSSSILGVIVFLGVFIIMLNIINGKSVGVAKLKQLTDGVGILDMEPGYSVEKAYNILEEQGTEGRAYYLKRIIPMDFIFPITYMLFYISVLLYLLKLLHLKNGIIHYVVFIPVFATMCDYIENLAIIKLLVYYPKKLITTVKIANLFTVSKLSFIFLCILSILILLILNLIIGFVKTKAN